MTTTASAVIKVAASQIGKYYPGDSPYGIWYAKDHGNVYRNAQFCAMGLSWCFDKVNGLDIFPNHAFTPSGVNWFKAKKRWHTGSVNNIKRGDIIYFNFPGAPNRVSHVGIAEKDGANGRVQTIEFNTSSTAAGSQRNGRTVARKVRSAYIVGWGRPAYKKSPSTSGYDNKGYSTAYIKNVQTLLKKVGYDIKADGYRGPASVKAIKDFQEKNGLVPDSIPGPATVGKLKDKVEAKSKDLRPLQKAVRAEEDGNWGPDVDKRLKAVRAASKFGGYKFPHGVEYTQRVIGVNPDGNWGPASIAAHDRAVINIQKKLLVLGYNTGVINGIWGPKIEAGYKAAREDFYRP